MILVIGGVCSGKHEYVFKTYGTCTGKLCDTFELGIKECLKRGESVEEYTEKIMQTYREGIIIATEIGCGIIPLEKEERIYREEVGRSLCIIAKQSEQVIRMQCGIPTQIK